MDTEYKIIGGDGAEYGPASLEEIKTWIGDGRVAGSTQVWRSDLAHWNPAVRYAELQQALARLQASVSPAALNRSLQAAGFWTRLGAYTLDRFLLVLLFGLLCQWRHWEIPAVPQVINPETYGQYVDKLGVLVPYLILLTVVYEVVLNGTFGATLGKMAVGAKIFVVDGDRLGYTRALARSLMARFVEMTFFVGYLPILVRSDKRGLHDLLAGTRVVLQR